MASHSMSSTSTTVLRHEYIATDNVGSDTELSAGSIARRFAPVNLIMTSARSAIGNVLRAAERNFAIVVRTRATRILMLFCRESARTSLPPSLSLSLNKRLSSTIEVAAPSRPNRKQLKLIRCEAPRSQRTCACWMIITIGYQ